MCPMREGGREGPMEGWTEGRREGGTEGRRDGGEGKERKERKEGGGGCHGQAWFFLSMRTCAITAYQKFFWERGCFGMLMPNLCAS